MANGNVISKVLWGVSIHCPVQLPYNKQTIRTGGIAAQLARVVEAGLCR